MVYKDLELRLRGIEVGLKQKASDYDVKDLYGKLRKRIEKLERALIFSTGEKRIDGVRAIINRKDSVRPNCDNCMPNIEDIHLKAEEIEKICPHEKRMYYMDNMEQCKECGMIFGDIRDKLPKATYSNPVAPVEQQNSSNRAPEGEITDDSLLIRLPKEGKVYILKAEVVKRLNEYMVHSWDAWKPFEMKLRYLRGFLEKYMTELGGK